MAKASIDTLLGLDQYAEILGLDPRHFNQLTSTAFPDKQTECSTVWYQYSWQSSKGMSRAFLSTAIARAERMIANQLRYWPAPKYVESELHVYPDFLLDGNIYTPNRRYTVPLKWGKFIRGGKRAATSLATEQAVILSDEDGDDFAETATITATIAGASSYLPEEIAVFPVGGGSDNKDRIRNLDVTISGTTVTITGQSAWFVDPSLWNKHEFINGDDPTVYLTEVDIYRIYTESNEDNPPVEIMWQDISQVTAFASAYGALQAWQPEGGTVSVVPVTWSSTTGAWAVSCLPYTTNPNLLNLNYLCGVPLDDGKVAEPYARAIAALATSLYNGEICAVSMAQDQVDYWRSFVDRRNTALISLTRCPFGNSFGAIEAWEIISSMTGYDSDPL